MPRASAATSKACRPTGVQFLEKYDAEAGRRSDRRPLARHLHRAEDHVEEPCLTVGTVTEIDDDMRLLWARVGVPYAAGYRVLPIESQTISQMVDRVLALPEGTRIYVLGAGSCAAARANTGRNWPSSCARATSASRSTACFTRLARSSRSHKEFYDDIDVVVDRPAAKGDIGTRLADSLKQRQS